MIKNYKNYTLAFILILLSLISCSKSDNISEGCLTELVPFTINFNVTDASGEDLFFSTNPSYIIDSLKIFRRTQNIEQPLPISVKEDNGRYIGFEAPADLRDTCFIQFSDNDVDTLIYVASHIQQDICSQLQLDSVFFNDISILPDQETIRYKFIK